MGVNEIAEEKEVPDVDSVLVFEPVFGEAGPLELKGVEFFLDFR